MKKGILLMAAAFAMLACSKEVELPASGAATKAGDYIEVTPDKTWGRYNQDTIRVAVQSNTSWTVKTSVPWLYAWYPAKGTGNATQSITVLPYSAGESPTGRTGTVTFTTASGVTKTLTLTQNADNRHRCDIRIELRDGYLRAVTSWAWALTELRVTVKFHINYSYGGSSGERTCYLESSQFWSSDRNSVYYSEGITTPSITITSVTPAEYDYFVFNVRDDQKPR